MGHAIIQHQVKDYDAWRDGFDDEKPEREGAGVQDVAVLRDTDDPNSVWVVFELDPAIVEPMMSDPARREAMEEAGVVSAPQVWVVP